MSTKDMEKHEAQTLLGASISTPAPPSYEGSQPISTFAMISFHMTDRIRFLQFPDEDLDKFRELVTSSWKPGIMHCKPYNLSFEIKLKKNPWMIKEASDPKAWKLAQDLLSQAYDIGWIIEHEVTMCKKTYQKETLLFRRSEQSPPPCDWFSISFDQYDILTIHAGPHDLCQALIATFAQKEWSRESAFVEERLEIRLKKNYWYPSGEDTIRVRLMLLTIFESLHSSGFKLYASIRLASSCDVLICNRMQDHNM